MSRLLSSVLVLGLAVTMISDASASGIRARVGNFGGHRPVIRHHVQRHVVHHRAPVVVHHPVHYCFQVHYDCTTWRCRQFHCEPDARVFSDYLCRYGFQTRIVFEGGCFVVHFYLPHCQIRTYNHRCDADSFCNLLCGYGIHAHVVAVRH